LFLTEESFLAHQDFYHLKNADSVKAQCKLCDEHILVSKVKSHCKINQNMQPQRSYTCRVCHVKFLANCKFKNHQKSHNFAIEANSEFYTPVKRKKEIQQDDTTTKTVLETVYSCKFCSQICETKKMLEYHLAEHDPVKFQASCVHCNKVFKTRKHLQIHIRLLHDNPEAYDLHCDICNKGFTDQHFLDKHKEKHNLPEKPYVCEKCGKGFAKAGKLTSHKQKHEDEESSQEFKCPECGKKLKHRHSLRKHINVQHKSKNVFMCEICGKQTKNRTNMRIHMQVHDTSRNIKRPYQPKPPKNPSADATSTSTEDFVNSISYTIL